MGRFDDMRVCAALSAAALGVLICLHQRHFVLSLTDLRTFRLMLHHRCGDVLAAAVLWAAIEVAARLLRELPPPRKPATFTGAFAPGTRARARS